MEQLRLLIAVVLSFIVFFGWNYFFGQKNLQKETVITKKEINEKKPETENPVLKNRAELEEKQSIIKKLPVDEKKYVVENSDYIAVFSSVGAKITSFKLKNYKSENKKDSPLKELIDFNYKKGSFFTDFQSVEGLNLEDANFLSKSPEHTNVSKDNEKIIFEYETREGLKIKKEYVFYKNSYLFDCNVSVINNMKNSFSNQLNISINSRKPQSRQIGFTGPAVFMNGKIKQIKTGDLDEEGNFSGKLEWGGLESIYFMTAFIPDSPETMISDFKIYQDSHSGLKREYIEAKFITNPFNIGAGEKKSFKFHYYLGPKSMKILNGLGYNLKEAVDFGFFDFISKPCLIVLNFIYKIIPNYGVSILILTLLVKIVFWPLGTKSAKSMEQMKKIQPLMKEIREKYKNDKQKMNLEVMNLYKTYKVNPLSGCLPILVQIPIFFGLYRMLFSAIELRHAPFILWIQDLSAPDRLFDLSFAIPFMKEPYGIPLLTIIMGATMFLQQKMTPAAGDPMQAKMMMFMPVFITVIFVNLPAGLVLYMLVNNVFSMGQQYYVTRFLSK